MGQKVSIHGPKAQSFKKQEDQRRPKQEKKATNESEVITIEKVHVEVQKELKQLDDANLKREQEQMELVNELQAKAKESSLLIVGLRSDLEDARQKMETFDNKVHELETRILEEQKVSSAVTKRAKELEDEIKSVRKQVETEIDLQRVRKEFEDEKTAREEAWAKISALEQEMSVAMRELDFERRRLKVASDKIMIVETHLGELHSTAVEMKDLFGKQQNQLKEMHMSLIQVEEEEEEKEEVHTDKKIDAGNYAANTTKAKETEMEPSSGETEAQLRNRVEAYSGENVPENKEDQAPTLVLQMTGISS